MIRIHDVALGQYCMRRYLRGILIGITCVWGLISDLTSVVYAEPAPAGRKTTDTMEAFRVDGPMASSIIHPGWTYHHTHELHRVGTLSRYDVGCVPIGTTATNRLRTIYPAERLTWSAAADTLVSDAIPLGILRTNWQLVFWSLRDGAYVEKLYGVEPSDVTFSPDGSLAAIESKAPPSVGAQHIGISIVDAKTGKRISDLVDSVRANQQKIIRSIFFASDNSKVVASINPGVDRVWSVADGKRLLDIKTARKITKISRDGSRIASIGFEGRIRLWNVSTSQLVDDLVGMNIDDFEFSPDGKSLLAHVFEDDETDRSWLVLYDASTGELKRTFRSDNRSVIAYTFSQNSKSVIAIERPVRSDDRSPELTEADIADDQEDHGFVCIYDIKSGSPSRAAPAGQIAKSPLCVGHERPLIVFGTTKGIEVWDTHLGRRILPISVQGGPAGIALSATDTVLAVSDVECRIRLISIADGSLTLPLEGHHGRVAAMAFSDTGSHVVSGGVDGKVLLWDVRSCRQLEVLRSGGAEIKCIAHTGSSNGWIALDSERNMLHWEKPSEDPTSTRLGRDIGYYYDARFSANGDFLVTRGKSLHVWSTLTASSIGEFRGVHSFAFAPAGDRIALAQRNKLLLFDVATQTSTAIAMPHIDKSVAAAFSPDGTILAIADEHRIRLHAIADFKLLGEFRVDRMGVASLVFTPSGEQLVATGYDLVEVWDVASKQRVARHLSGRRKVLDATEVDMRTRLLPLGTIAMSPGGKFVITESSDIAPISWQLK